MIEPMLLPKLALIGGLAVWLSIIVLNNFRNFAGGALSIGTMMSMRLFDEPPVIQTPLLSRRVTSPFWHKAVMGFVLVVELLVAVALWVACIAMLGALCGMVGAAEVQYSVNFALAGFLMLCFILAWGGAWFVYYVKQESAQIAHFALLGVGIAATILVNLR